MRRPYILLTLGIWVAVLPYLGFPYFWKNILFTLSGLGLMYVSFLMYKEFKHQKKNKKETYDNFSENGFTEEK
ncbi:MAG: hypothetical protein Q7K54_06690 [Candidatus Parcubacteria bacterium]|nr:hypothetical protein [Candidatus Parcubacteria bacterium]